MSKCELAFAIGVAFGLMLGLIIYNVARRQT